MGRKEDSKVTRRVSAQQSKTKQNIFNFPSRPKEALWYMVHRFLYRSLNIVHLSTWDSLLKRYVNDPKNGIPPTPEARTSARGNMTTQIYSEDEGMSINNFVKAAVVAGVEELELITIWKMPDGKRIVGKVRYPLTDAVIMNLRDDENDAAMIAELTTLIHDRNENEMSQAVSDVLLKHKKIKTDSGEVK